MTFLGQEMLSLVCFSLFARRVVMTKLANANDISLHDAAKHVGVVARTLGVYHRKGEQVKSKAAMLLSKHHVPQSKEEEEIKAKPCPKPEVKAEPCPNPQKQDSPIKVEPESPPRMDNRQLSTYTGHGHASTRKTNSSVAGHRLKCNKPSARQSLI